MPEDKEEDQKHGVGSGRNGGHQAERGGRDSRVEAGCGARWAAGGNSAASRFSGPLPSGGGDPRAGAARWAAISCLLRVSIVMLALRCHPSTNYLTLRCSSGSSSLETFPGLLLRMTEGDVRPTVVSRYGSVTAPHLYRIPSFLLDIWIFIP